MFFRSHNKIQYLDDVCGFVIRYFLPVIFSPLELRQACQLSRFQCKSHGLTATHANLTGSQHI